MTPEDLLKKDHASLRALFEKLDTALGKNSSSCAEVFNELSAAVRGHFRREDPYYGRIDAGKRIDDRGLMHELRNDHAAVLFTLESLKIRLRKSGIVAEWKSRYQAMRDVLITHFRTEEEKLFPKTAVLLNEDERNALLAEMQA